MVLREYRDQLFNQSLLLETNACQLETKEQLVQI